LIVSGISADNTFAGAKSYTSNKDDTDGSTGKLFVVCVGFQERVC